MKQFIHRASFLIGIACFCASVLCCIFEFTGISRGGLQVAVGLYAWAIVFAVVNHGTRSDFWTNRSTMARRLGRTVGRLARTFHRSDKKSN